MLQLQHWINGVSDLFKRVDCSLPFWQQRVTVASLVFVVVSLLKSTGRCWDFSQAEVSVVFNTSEAFSFSGSCIIRARALVFVPVGAL